MVKGLRSGTDFAYELPTATLEALNADRRRMPPPSSSQAWFFHIVIAHATYNGVRVLISFRTLELGSSGIVLGLVTACYSLVPLLTALLIGCLVD